MSEEKKTSIRDAFRAFQKDPTESDKLLKCLNDYREAWHSERKQAHDSLWKQEAAFYAGNHYVRDTGVANTTYKVRLRENHVNNILNRMISIFVQNMPITRVFANSINNQDLSDAESTELYGKFYWRTKKMEQKLAKFIKYASIFGNGFAFTQFDPDMGGKVQLHADETQSGDPETRYYHGDVRVDIDDPFKILVRPGIDELDDMYDFIRSIPASKQMLEEKYGELEADAAVAMNAYTGNTRKDDEMVMQHHYYHKPTPWFEEGMYACWAGKKLIKARPAAEAEKDLQLVHLAFDKPPMKLYGTSSIEQVMDLQEQLNRAASMIVEARNLVARPRWSVPQEAQMPGQSISDRPGDIMRWKGNPYGGPKIEVPNFNFSEMQAHKNDVRGAMSQVMGITGASRGEIPQATKTALALQLVLEQDRSQYLPFIKNFHQAILDIMMRIFSQSAYNFDAEDPRLIKIEMASHAIARPFHGGMVPIPLDCYLEDTNPLGWTAAGRAEQVMNLIDRGAIKDPNKALEMLKISNPDPAYQMEQINKQAAAKEIELLNKGTMVNIGPEDDDPTHLDEHVKVVASFSFRNLPKAVQDVHNAHIKQHKDRLAPPAPPPGAPGAAPGGPPPPGAPPMGHMGPPPPHPMMGPPHGGMHHSGASAQAMEASLAAPGGSTMDTLLSKVRS